MNDKIIKEREKLMQFVVDTVGGANEPQKPHEISVAILQNN